MNTILQHKPQWTLITFSYLMAIGVALIVRSDFFQNLYRVSTSGLIVDQWTFLPAGLGTLIAALFARQFDTITPKTISIIGNFGLKNIMISIVPFFVFTGFGLSNTNGLQNNVHAGIFAFVSLSYALSEELFWRGYLQDALRPMNIFVRTTFIGILWWAWHLRFFSVFEWTGFLGICIGSSFLLSKFVEETESILTAAGLHSFIILATTNTQSDSNIAPIALVIILWFIIGKFWRPSANTLEIP